jgi:hypothetical protein
MFEQFLPNTNKMLQYATMTKCQLNKVLMSTPAETNLLLMDNGVPAAPARRGEIRRSVSVLVPWKHHLAFEMK